MNDHAIASMIWTAVLLVFFIVAVSLPRDRRHPWIARLAWVCMFIAALALMYAVVFFIFAVATS